MPLYEFFLKNPDGWIEIDFERETYGFVSYLYDGRSTSDDDGWKLSGKGGTPEEAISDLSKQLERL